MKDFDENKNKRKKDQFSVTIIGVVIYSVILIFVMAGTYLGIKTAFKHHEEKLAMQAAAEEDVQEEQPIEEPVEEESEPEESNAVETVLNEHSIDLSSVCDSNTRYINYDQTLFEPAKRDKTLTWQDNVFSRIENMENPSEAVVNTFDYKHLYAYLLDGSKVTYDVFINPETELIEKIKYVIYRGDCTEVMLLYYDLGNLNYVAHYSKVVDSPINIASADVESRYYFCNDEMVKYTYCENNTATEYVVADIDTYSQGTVEQFDYLEKSMLNTAYITYNAAKGLPETEVLSGYVQDEFNQPMKGAKITAMRDTDNTFVAETTTTDDGYYSFEINVDDSSTFTLVVEQPTLQTVKVYNVTAHSGSGEYMVEPVYMSYEQNVQEYNLQILVRDATDMTKPLPMATIKYRSGINNTDGEVIASGVLNEAGAVITPIRAGCYTAQVSLGGYEDAFFTVIVKADHQAVLGYAVPDLADNTYATVLSWDTTPLDLDAKVISSNGARVLRAASDSIGSTTPEVIYVENVGTDDYSYFVSDYTACTGGDPLSYNMSSSNANVTIYNFEGIVASYHVPVGHSGVVWEAFKMRNYRVLPVNRYYYAIEPNSYWDNK